MLSLRKIKTYLLFIIIDNDKKKKKEDDKTNENIFFYVLLRSLQLAFGYAGLLANFIVAILLLLFLIPLGINLAGAINSLEVTNSSGDPFDVFPVDPYPSSTICFTNSSIIDQEVRWENKTTPFSNSCNKTFEAIPCFEVRDTIITKLSIMIGISTGILILVGGAFLLAYIIDNCSDEEDSLRYICGAY